jgi:DNA-binding LacI/PurR family transcriptional regulator
MATTRIDNQAAARELTEYLLALGHRRFGFIFDDTPMAVTVWPALTTIHQPVAEMARAAVDLVMEEIRRKRSGGTVPRQLLHPYTLVVRESSGPVTRQE